jgi:DNA-binding NtrC family response regulator
MTGIQSIGFTAAEEAVEWYKLHYATVDMIVLDMKMAKMDGPVCFDLLRGINPKARVTILSGYVQDAAAQELLSKGALRFFQKPLKYPELVRWIADEISPG